jgi:hypothetical protein
MRRLYNEKNKTFDCLQMKWDIQQQINKEFSTLSKEEAYNIQQERIRNNKVLGPFIQKVNKLKTVNKTLEKQPCNTH